MPIQCWCTWCFKSFDWGFPVVPVVKTSSSHAGDVGLISGWGTKTPHAFQAKKQNIKNRANIVTNSIKTLKSFDGEAHIFKYRKCYVKIQIGSYLEKLEDLETLSTVPKVSSNPDQQHLLGLECLLKVPHTHHFPFSLKSGYFRIWFCNSPCNFNGYTDNTAILQQAIWT